MKSDPDCIFCKIIAGDIPCYSIYEDEVALAFLDIHPVSKGHTLVIPKHHQDHIDDLPIDIHQHIHEVAYDITKILKQKLNPVRVGRAVIGIDVPHAHLHLIPIYEGGEIKLSQNFEAEVEHAKLSVLANKLKIGDLPQEDS